jgi:hypothetical protein
VRYGVHLDAAAPIDGAWSAAGVPLRVPTQPLLAALLAAHLSGELYSMRLLRLAELVLVVRQDRALGRLDWAAVEALLEETGGLRFAYPAFALAERLAPGTVDARLLARTRRASTRVARFVVGHITPGTPVLEDRVSLAERLMWVSGPADALRRIAAMAVPVGNAPLATVLQAYRGRIGRLVGGRVSWRLPPPARSDVVPTG